jgi:hypothetical protein
VRDRVLRVLLAVLPDDADLRGANRETQVKGGRWVLAETAASQAGRDRVAAAVKAARAAAAEARQTVVLGRSRGEWKVSVTTQAIEILSQLTQPETDDAVRAALVSHALMGELFGRPATLRRGFRVYLLPDLQSSAGFLAKISELSDAEREHFERYGSYWLDGELVVALSAHAERLDCVSRQVMPGVTTPIGRLLDTPPWIREGLGMYLTYQLLGTRETVFVQSGSYDDEALAREVAQVNSDWVQIARKLVERGYDPNLAVLTGLPMNAMTKDDGLMAYALASYFVEGRPSDLAALLTGLSQAEKGAFHRVLAETCGVDVTALQARFVRWLHELPKK